MERNEDNREVYEGRSYTAPKNIGAFNINLEKRRAEFEAQHGKGVEHEYQQIGKELEPIYGKRIWADFTRSKATEAKIRRAHEICIRRGKSGNYPYVRGVLRNL